MIETVHTFGADESLIGIVTEPEAGTPGRPAVVLLNSGLLPRTGTFRLHVTLARALARLGFLVLRFDLAGIGDSLQHMDGRSRAEQVAGDIQDAMAYLTSIYQHDSFVVAGLCILVPTPPKYLALPRVSTEFPIWGPLPQISHLRAIATSP